MGGLARAFGRLLIMGAVMAAVVVTCLIVGVGPTIAVALGIVLAGLVGLTGVARRPRQAAEATEAVAPSSAHGRQVQAPGVGALSAGAPGVATSPGAGPMDPEALMPRWRRPSLLEARRADPSRPTGRVHTPLRFDGPHTAQADRRIVRYAVVPVLDRPDEVLGVRLIDLGAGDEVEVVGASGTFLEVICATGERGWIHRTTVSQPMPAHRGPGPVEVPAEAEDALTALLAARGLR